MPDANVDKPSRQFSFLNGMKRQGIRLHLAWLVSEFLPERKNSAGEQRRQPGAGADDAA
jgi:hypothetical protein